MNTANTTEGTIKNNIREAVQRFIKKDKDSLVGIKVHEGAISHRIAVYLESLFPESNIDCEYNKHYDGSPKESGGVKIRPDIIVHTRGGWNAVAIIEIKKASPDSKLGRGDIQKVKNARENLGYKIGAYIGVLKRKVHIVWISDRQGLEREILK